MSVDIAKAWRGNMIASAIRRFKFPGGAQSEDGPEVIAVKASEYLSTEKLIEHVVTVEQVEKTKPRCKQDQKLAGQKAPLGDKLANGTHHCRSRWGQGHRCLCPIAGGRGAHAAWHRSEPQDCQRVVGQIRDLMFRIK